MPATSKKKSASREEEKEPPKPVRQDLRAALRHDPQIERLGIGAEACRHLGAGFYPAGEKSRSPLAGEFVFQARRCRMEGEKIVPYVVSHVGVAPGADAGFKEWTFYPNFKKEEAVFGLDCLLTDERAIQAARESETLILLQDPLDTAKVVSAENFNVASSFGPFLSEAQVDQIEQAAGMLGIKKVLVWFHRGEGAEQERAVKLLHRLGLGAVGFNWAAQFIDRERGPVAIHENLSRAVDFSAEQVAFVIGKARQQEQLLRLHAQRGWTR